MYVLYRRPDVSCRNFEKDTQTFVNCIITYADNELNVESQGCIYKKIHFLNPFLSTTLFLLVLLLLTVLDFRSSQVLSYRTVLDINRLEVQIKRLSYT